MPSVTTLSSSASTRNARLSRAQEAYRDYRVRCFWFMKDDLIVTEANLPLIIEGLKLHGGHKGWKLAHELCL
jgi:hypothetical protein